ncbi:MAG TPA: 3-oxoacyl-[acyl-carrier-protein] synthase III C-terminal domain-containing protein [Rubrobacteraceae bacterium]|jgi:alkylresorcinol/alkylpyrone synthase|nr:3-oxoacyl-[acyl-carrier-protein] synthase III C-terminal domain-containing protein [Rubrobacteraceae bacterium]
MTHTNPRILSVATAVPHHQVSQETARDFARLMFSDTFRDVERLLPVFDNSGIESRYFCVPPEWFGDDHGFPEKNALYVEHALDLSEKAATRVLDKAGVRPEDVGAIFFVSTTGIATPSLDSRLIFRLGMSENIRRVPIWGLGCAGGAAGLARASEYARAYSEKPVLLVGVELCGLTFLKGDRSKSNLIATSLFADGAAAVLLGGEQLGAGPELRGSYSTTWPGTEDVMGWDVVDDGLKVRFAKSVPVIVHEKMRGNLETACASLDLGLEDLRHFVLHPGGPKVLEAYENTLGIGRGNLELSWEILREYGNMSSVSVLFVLERFLEEYPQASGEYGTISALGPGFSAEHVLFRC